MSQNANSPEKIARNYAYKIMLARAALLAAGGQDDSVQLIIQIANAEFCGNVEAAGEALLLGFQKQVEDARNLHTKEHAKRQERLDSPAVHSLFREMNEALAKALEIERSITMRFGPSPEENRQARVKNLITMGVCPAAAEAAADQVKTDENKRQEGIALRARASEIESQISRIADGVEHVETTV